MLFDCSFLLAYCPAAEYAGLHLYSCNDIREVSDPSFPVFLFQIFQHIPAMCIYPFIRDLIPQRNHPPGVARLFDPKYAGNIRALSMLDYAEFVSGCRTPVYFCLSVEYSGPTSPVYST